MHLQVDMMGRDFWIDDLHINRGSSSEIGLFGVVSNGQIINVRLFDASITGNNRVGVLAGDVTNNSTISSITIVESSVTGSVTVGGVIGRTSSTGIHEYLSYSGTISGVFDPDNHQRGTNVGGVIGKMQNNTLLSKSYFNGNISGFNFVGGIVGQTTNSASVKILIVRDMFRAFGAGGVFGFCFIYRSTMFYIDYSF